VPRLLALTSIHGNNDRVQLERRIEEREDESGSRVESRINLEVMEKIPYRVVERIYRETTETAFVLPELEL
jgi:hypothetical protein